MFGLFTKPNLIGLALVLALIAAGALIASIREGLIDYPIDSRPEVHTNH